MSFWMRADEFKMTRAAFSLSHAIPSIASCSVRKWLPNLRSKRSASCRHYFQFRDIICDPSIFACVFNILMIFRIGRFALVL